MVKHDENKDVRLVGKVCKVNFYDKSIIAPKSAIIGNRVWGRIDFLVNHCGYTFHRTTDPIVLTKSVEDELIDKKQLKKQAKEHKLTNKRK